MSTEDILKTFEKREQHTASPGNQWSEPIPLLSANELSTTLDYPIGKLPDSLRTAATEVARFVKVPEVAAAVVGLSVLATALGKQILIEERKGLTHHPSFFFALIAPSGTRKSPVFEIMSQPIKDWSEEQMEPYEVEVRKIKANNEVIDTCIAALKKKIKDPNKDFNRYQLEIQELENRRLSVPPHPWLFTTDTTEERLFQKMYEHSGAYAVLSGEGRPVLDAIMGKYSGPNRTGDAIYLAGISGDTITRDRISGKDKENDGLIIRKPCLNACLMVQPGKYFEAASMPSLRESGALARILPVILPSCVGSRLESANELGLQTPCLKDYQELVQYILNQSKRHRSKPHMICLSDKATEARRIFHNELESNMGKHGKYHDVCDIASKIVSQAVKLAGIIHMVNNPKRLSEDNSIISLEDWEAAETLIRFHLEEAVRVQRLAEDGIICRHAQRILEWIHYKQYKMINPIEILKNAPRPRLRAKERELILDLLVEHHYLEPEPSINRRNRNYLVNEKWLQRSSPT